MSQCKQLNGFYELLKRSPDNVPLLGQYIRSMGYGLGDTREEILLEGFCSQHITDLKHTDKHTLF